MPHSSTHIYTETVGGVKYGISIGDIQSMFGLSRNDIGALIVNANINKWAKYKPYRNSSPATTQAARVAAHYGLSIVTAESLGSPSSASSFLGRLVRDQLGWEYQRPRGLSQNEWFRFLDFDGYFRDAVCPVGDVSPVSWIDNSGNTTIAWDMLDNLDAGNITLADIVINGTPLTGFYLGVLLYQSDTQWEVLTSSSVLGTGDVQINLTNATSLEGTWKAYPFFSSVQIPRGGQLGTGVYVAAGWDTYQTIRFRRASGSLTVVAYGAWNSAYSAVDFDVVAVNEVSTARTITPYVFIERVTRGGTPGTGSDVAHTTLSQMTVPANGQAQASGTLYYSPGSSYGSYDWYIGVQVEGFQTQYMQIEEPELPE